MRASFFTTNNGLRTTNVFPQPLKRLVGAILLTFASCNMEPSPDDPVFDRAGAPRIEMVTPLAACQTSPSFDPLNYDS